VLTCRRAARSTRELEDMKNVAELKNCLLELNNLIGFRQDALAGLDASYRKIATCVGAPAAPTCVEAC
jgi:hypothetical protein